MNRFVCQFFKGQVDLLIVLYLIQYGVDPAKVKILGIPISVQFLTSHPREGVGRELGFNVQQDSVLIMGGGLGIGPMEHIAQQLDALEHDFQIIAICGKNQKLYNWFVRNEKRFKKPIFYFANLLLNHV